MDSYYRQRQQLSNGSTTESGFPVGLIIFFRYCPQCLSAITNGITYRRFSLCVKMTGVNLKIYNAGVMAPGYLQFNAHINTEIITASHVSYHTFDHILFMRTHTNHRPSQWPHGLRHRGLSLRPFAC